MDARELVELARAIVGRKRLHVRSITVTYERDGDFSDHTIHSNGDLFYPYFVDGLYPPGCDAPNFSTIEEALDHIKRQHGKGG